ncbi:hypothetical protein LMG24238_07687 [Paraburkholderia sediminicola]|uniref:Uncharacterized protein n=1 Tax=Paraburkholderia sediminicola TaxID=458836 RepID=A0A6J5CWP6_9BURK|nr:hypothetical protein [Paraburkholderia sediminicola]CAB3745560.1 hypothetical protein LMG24238_07687 [Paraburkholderia sediminicola]
MAKVRVNAKVADALIIGAGASGMVAARHLSECLGAWCVWSRVPELTMASSPATSPSGS